MAIARLFVLRTHRALKTELAKLHHVLSLQQPYVIDLVISQYVSRPAIDIFNTVSDSNIMLIATLLHLVRVHILV